MANNNNDNNPDTNNHNDNNNDDSPIQPRRSLLGAVLNSLRTPLQNRNQIERQELINRQYQQQDILNLEASLGLRTRLFEEEGEEEEEEETIIMTSTTYTIGGIKIEFDTDTPTPTQDTDYNVSVMIAKEDRPAAGSDVERKLIKSLCRNQYTKHKKAETSMKSIERLLQSLQSRSIMDKIEATETILIKFDMKDPFIIVYPEDPTLNKVSLKMMSNGSGIRSLNLPMDFRQVTVEEVALSCAWWNVHGHYKDNTNVKQSYGRDMNWSYLHFKSHVKEVLYNDIDKLFNSYTKKERGGPLFFKLLSSAVLSSNEDSLAALEFTIKNYNIAKDGKDDVPESIKILKAGSKLITAMQDDGSNKPSLPDKFVVNLIGVFRTTSVDMFNNKMEAYQGSLELAYLIDKTQQINTPTVLGKVFLMAENYHNQLFDEGIWETQVQSKAKASFATFWQNCCWNFEKENCSMTRCPQPKDADKCERNRLKWLSDVQAN
jgi:hypothetical protein